MHAKTSAQIHSPYLFALLQFIHDRTRRYYVFDTIEQVRAELMRRDDEVENVDYGAGSKIKRRRTVKAVAQTSLSSAAQCQTIFRLITYQKPHTILELGTSLGIMSAYLAAVNKETTVHTVEGNPSLSAIASDIASRLGLTNITFYTGRFSVLVPKLTEIIDKIDFLLIDGDHRGESLKEYFMMLKPILSINAIVMIDDIRWSADMYIAWNAILQDTDVTCSLDYFSFGLLFFQKDFLDPIHVKIMPPLSSRLLVDRL
ncbi:MAG TPA: class I SAM-dependent methyltransferase [Saprospiraceae bacterium]|nr:class I SAM-dependent methyltransferase [Saprospiraceae bacterium]